MSWGASPSDFVNPRTLIGALVYAALVLAVALVAHRAVRAVARAALGRQPDGDRDPTAVLFLQQLGQIAVWVAAVVAYAHLIPGLQALGTALLAGASVASIVLGLAAQTTLGNLVAGVSLLLYRPFKVGDRLQIAAPTGLETGTVERVTLGYTVVLTVDHRRVVLPNSVAANQTTINLTAIDSRTLAVVPVGIAYDADLERARAILLELAQAHPRALEVVGCPVVGLGDSRVTLSVQVWCRDGVAAREFEYDLYEQAKNRFAHGGIEIPYPYTNVVVKRET